MPGRCLVALKQSFSTMLTLSDNSDLPGHEGKRNMIARISTGWSVRHDGIEKGRRWKEGKGRGEMGEVPKLITFHN